MNESPVMLVSLGFVLLYASYSDIRSHRIANILTFPAVLLGITLNTYLHAGAGFVTAVSGLLFGLLCLLPFYIAGGMAAGDVKLMGTVGAFIGMPLILKAVLMSLVCGSVLGLLWLIRFNGVGEFLRRYLLVGKYTLMTGHLHYIPPQKGSAALLRFPYAVAISCGTFLVLWIAY